MTNKQTNKQTNTKEAYTMTTYKLTGLLATQLNKLAYKEPGNIDKLDYQDQIHLEIVDIIRSTTSKEDLIILEQAEQIYRQMANRFTTANRKYRKYISQRLTNNRDLEREINKANFRDNVAKESKTYNSPSFGQNDEVITKIRNYVISRDTLGLVKTITDTGNGKKLTEGTVSKLVTGTTDKYRNYKITIGKKIPTVILNLIKNK